MPDFRISTPSQTCNKAYRNYRGYKKYLIKDFSNRCGYCDGSDTWHGGYKYYHIDHYQPKDQFPELKTTYSNLIYACPTCNLSKSNKWPGFLNPIYDDLNAHLNRDEEGVILGNTVEGKNVVKELNLHLERHAVIWKLTKLENIAIMLEDALQKNLSGAIKSQTERLQYELLRIFFYYQQMLKELNTE